MGSSRMALQKSYPQAPRSSPGGSVPGFSGAHRKDARLLHHGPAHNRGNGSDTGPLDFVDLHGPFATVVREGGEDTGSDALRVKRQKKRKLALEDQLAAIKNRLHAPQRLHASSGTEAVSGMPSSGGDGRETATTKRC